MTLLRSFPAFAPEKKTEPAKRWRNVWACNEPPAGVTYFPCDACGVIVIPFAVGDRYSCNCTFPTRDVAETIAQESIEACSADGYRTDDYLGAFPVEDAP